MATVRSCCRCNRNGRCGNCSCRKAGNSCQSCLPGRLGYCTNQTASASVATQNLPRGVHLDNSNTSITSSQVTLTAEPNHEASDLNTVEGIKMGSSFESSPDQSEGSPISALPVFEPMVSPTFTWGERDSESTIASIESAYSEVMHWKKQLFPVPWGNAGSAFISELAHLYKAYAERTTLECITLKVAAIMPGLLLQKPHRSSKHKEHKECLERRLKLWKEGDFEALLAEGRTLQLYQTKRIPHRMVYNLGKLDLLFAKKMFEGKVKDALRLLTDEAGSGVLDPKDKISYGDTTMTVLDALKDKHPEGKPASKNAFLTENNQAVVHPVIFDKINTSLIRSTVLRTMGLAGSSGMDVKSWRRIYTFYKRE